VFIVPDSSSRDSSGMAAGGTPLAALQPLLEDFLTRVAKNVWVRFVQARRAEEK
jgi:hypothetical protein